MTQQYILPDFDEASSSQIPAILQLINLGYQYIGRQEANDYRDSKNQYILHRIARGALRKINPPEISDKSIDEALFALEKIKLDDGIIKASEEVFSDLLGGRAVSEIIDGKRTSPQLKFIDWNEPGNNLFHVVAEFEISEQHDRRPDIVLFVNGIPLAVIENKKASVSIDEAINQMIRNQEGNQVPRFFLYPQLLVACNVNALKYGTMQTKFEFYSIWKEKDAGTEYESAVLESVNKSIDKEVLKQISRDLFRTQYIQAPKKTISEQDKGIYSLLKPERLLDLVRNYILYDNGIKKVTRYQQYFGIKKTLKRIMQQDETGKRKGGLIWHTQGSGKSLTMVMLVKCLIEKIQNPRVIVVTDRTDLDIQIRDTFKACNIKVGVQQATSSKDLIKRIKSKTTDVITTLVHKFERETPFKDNDNNIFVLIDEAHRTQGGDANAQMNRILPRACQIAFTGTPLMKQDKSVHKFGGLIDAYTISEAESDGAILPLVYQGRFVDQTVNTSINDFYNEITSQLTDAQKKDFEKKTVSAALLEETTQRIDQIALDIHKHYKENFLGTGLKGQLVAPSKYAAIQFKKALDLFGDIKSEVIISDTRVDEGDEDKLAEHKAVVSKFLAEEKRQYGSLEAREKRLIQSFKHDPDGCDMVIVVDKLLTGFDAPRNTVLYLAKQLKDHNLLQAIARVNRVYNGDAGKQIKNNGLVIDYSKNAKNLRDALKLFSHYDPEDIERALLGTDEQIKILEDLYQKLHTTFAGVEDIHNTDAYVQILKDDEQKKEAFYDNVSKFIRAMSSCFSLYDFHQKFSEEKLRRYQRDLKRFVEIKKTTQIALAEQVDFSKYKDQLHRLLDKYVTADSVEILSKEINLSDMREFNKYIEDEKNGLSEKSKAAAIAAQTSKVIRERYHRDEIFYQKFSDRIEALLEALKTAKKEDISFLFKEMQEIQQKVENYEDNDIPEDIRTNKLLHPFYRNLLPLVNSLSIDPTDFCKIVRHLVSIVQNHKIVDFETNAQVKRNCLIAMEDYLFDEISIRIPPKVIEAVGNKTWEIAVENKNII